MTVSRFEPVNTNKTALINSDQTRTKVGQIRQLLKQTVRLKKAKSMHTEMIPDYVEEAIEKALSEVKASALVELMETRGFLDAVAKEVQKGLDNFSFYLFAREGEETQVRVYPSLEADVGASRTLENLVDETISNNDEDEIKALAEAFEGEAKRLRIKFKELDDAFKSNAK